MSLTLTGQAFGSLRKFRPKLSAAGSLSGQALSFGGFLRCGGGGLLRLAGQRATVAASAELRIDSQNAISAVFAIPVVPKHSDSNVEAIAGHGAGDQVAFVDGQINVRDGLALADIAADAILKIGGLLNAGGQDRFNGAKVDTTATRVCP